MKRKKVKVKSSNSESSAMKKKKITLLKSYSESNCPLNFKSCKTLLESLLSPVCSFDRFCDEYWEKKPLFVPASSKVSYPAGLNFLRSILVRVIQCITYIVRKL